MAEFNPDIDFDPTTEEGQEDINNEEDEPLLEQADRDPIKFRNRARNNPSLRQRFLQAVNWFKEKNPGNTKIPEYEKLQEEIEMEDFPIGPREEMVRDAWKSIKERFPNVEDALLDVQVVDRGKIQVKYHNKQKWYNLYQIKNPDKINNQLTVEIKKALGDPNQRAQLEGVENQLSESQEKLDQEEAEKEEIRGQLETAPPEEAARLRQQLSEKDAEIARLKTTIDGALAERQRILEKTAVLEEQLRQRGQAIEDLERQAEEQRQIISDSSRTEEEIGAAKAKLEGIQERIAEMQSQKENLERELGLTTKEKIKRALLKYGLPLAAAVAVSSVMAVIINMLKATGAGVKKVGQGLTNLGKKMAASIPGLLGSVLSLVLKTGGELLKFVGNNIWILVVAIGAVFLKRLR